MIHEKVMIHEIGGTMTAEGFIPYARIDGIDMPIALKIPHKAPIQLLKMYQYPQRIDGRLLYVTPHGHLVHSPENKNVLV